MSASESVRAADRKAIQFAMGVALSWTVLFFLVSVGLVLYGEFLMGLFV